MSFFRIYIICHYKHIKTQAFLRAKIYIIKFLKKINSFNIIEKRILLFSSLKCKASMAVEAAIAIPFFLFFIMNILFAFDMLRLHSNLMGAMHQVGNKMAFHGYAYQQAEEAGITLPKELSSVIMSQGYVRNKVITTLGSDYLDHTCLVAGTSGLQFLKSSIMQEDIIDIIATYRVRPFIKVIGFPDFPMENRYYGRAWTGYDVVGGQGGEHKGYPIVYVADTGVVYHITRNCTYLCPSIEMISMGMKEEVRNENGGKYYACERCGSNGMQPILYITLQGNRYHCSLQCSGLKRTIYAVHLSEVGGKGQCSKCE